jgi:hypothetical protein
MQTVNHTEAGRLGPRAQLCPSFTCREGYAHFYFCSAGVCQVELSGAQPAHRPIRLLAYIAIPGNNVISPSIFMSLALQLM